MDLEAHGVFEWLIDFDLWLAALRMNMFGGYEASVIVMPRIRRFE